MITTLHQQISKWTVHITSDHKSIIRMHQYNLSDGLATFKIHRTNLEEALGEPELPVASFRFPVTGNLQLETGNPIRLFLVKNHRLKLAIHRK